MPCTTPLLPQSAISHASRGWRQAVSVPKLVQHSAKTTPRRTEVQISESSRVASSTERTNFLEVVVGGEVLEEVTLLLHDAVELVNVDLTITITVGLVDHVLELLIVDVLTELLSNTGEVAEGDLVGVVVIEELEYLLDVLAGVLLTHLSCHHLEEFGELDGAIAIAIDVGDHLLELLVLDFKAEGTHGGLELTHVDGAGGVRIEKGKGFTDFVKLLLGELTGFFLSTTTRHV